MLYLGGQRGLFSKGDSADMCAGKFPLMSMGGRAEGLACEGPGVRTPIGVSGNHGYYQTLDRSKAIIHNSIAEYSFCTACICINSESSKLSNTLYIQECSISLHTRSIFWYLLSIYIITKKLFTDSIFNS